MQGPCKTCDEKDKGFGGCRCQAYMLTGDMYKTDPVCSKSPDHGLMAQAVKNSESPSRELVYRDPKVSIPITEI